MPSQQIQIQKKKKLRYLKQQVLWIDASCQTSDQLLLTVQFFITFTQKTLVTILHGFLSFIHFIA